MQDLKTKLRNGLFWSGVQVLVRRGLDFIVKLVLLNLLFPEDFGLVGMATAVTSLLYVIGDFGWRTALVQKKDGELLDGHLQSVFWWSILWSTLIFSFIYFAGASIIAAFYEEPILENILIILSVPILLNSLTLISRVKMIRNLQFKQIGIIESIALIFSSIIALTIAFKGVGLWSLVVYIAIPFIFSAPLYFLFYPIQFKPRFDIKVLREFSYYGIFTCLTAIVLMIMLKINHVFIGKIMGERELGIYSFAFMMTILVSSQVTSMVDRVLFPFYSKIQARVDIIKKYYLLSLQFYMYLLLPIMLALLVYGPQIIKVFFGIKWLDAKTPIRILALSVLINLLTKGCNLVYRSIGKSKLEFKILFFTLICIILPCTYVGSFYGLIGVCIGTLVSSFCYLIISLYFLKRELSVTLLDIIIKLRVPVFAFSITAIIIVPLYFYTSWHLFILLFVLGLIYFQIVYRFHKSLIRKGLQKFINQVQ